MELEPIEAEYMAPEDASSNPSPGYSISEQENSRILNLRSELIAAIEVQLPTLHISQIIGECITVFFERSFSTFPICHEASLRAYALFFFGPPGQSINTWQPNRNADSSSIQLLRSFALLNAVCAATSFIHQTTFLPNGATAGPLFFRASRQAYKEYDDYDLQNPDSSSLQIRMLFSTCFQLYTGESGLAWHAVAEAGLLARNMRLYREHMISRADSMEGTLLRSAFWTLYMADSSAMVMGNRAAVLHEPLFDGPMDVEPLSPSDVPLMAANGAEHSLLLGFHRIQKVWHFASKVMFAIRSYIRCQSGNLASSIQEAELAKVTLAYSKFVTSLDDIPASLQSPAFSAYDDNPGASFDITSSYAAQRFRLLSGYYFSRALIIQNCVRHNLASAIGIRDEESAQTAEVINAAREAIHTLQSVPFHYVLGHGESCVSHAHISTFISSDFLISYSTGRGDPKRRKYSA